MKDETRCYNCHFSWTTGDEDQDPVFFCHRFPPSTDDGFPVVSGLDWCGEFEYAEVVQRMPRLHLRVAMEPIPIRKPVTPKPPSGKSEQ